MDTDLLLIVLFAALLHAVWNALLKSSHDKLVQSVLLATTASMVALLALPFVPTPHPASWPYLGASVAIHAIYFCFVAYAYRYGDLSFVYPLMRGSAPLLTALITVFAVGEPLGLGGWLGVSLLSSGVLCLALDGQRSGRIAGRAWIFGLSNALVIVSYTVVDGLGVRAAGNAWSYVLWMSFLNAFPVLAFGLLMNSGGLRSLTARDWRKGFVTGSCSIGSYGLALWAMAYAPIALVAALRETSVLFGTVIAAVVLREQFGPWRWLAAALIVTGAAAMKAL
jgi:drug/metabolite transporter (DMT)-like permease